MRRCDRRSALDVALLTVLCLALYVPGLSAIPPLDRDEARFAQATKQMVESGDFVRPHFQDQPRFKKPIGIYWLQSAAVLAVGSGARRKIWPYRLPSVLGALIAVLMTYGAGRYLFDRPVAFLGAALLAASALLVVEAHVATTDAALLACVVGAQSCLAALYAAERRGQRAPARHAMGFWIAQGLGILIKGPIAPMVSGLTAVTLCVANRRGSAIAEAARAPGGEISPSSHPPLVSSGRERRPAHAWLGGLRWRWGVPLMLAIVLPWAVAVGIQTRWSFFAELWRGDLLPKLLGAHESHGGPPGYYLLLSLATFWPGSLVSGLGVLHAWRRRHGVGERFCLAWLAPVWLLFELAPTKLPHYVLPTYPALALLTASAARAATAGQLPAAASTATRAGLWLWGLATVTMATVALAGTCVLGRAVALITAILVVVAAGMTVISLRLRARAQLTRALWMATIAATIGVAPCLQWIVPNLDQLWLSRAAAHAITTHGGAASGGREVAAVGYREPSLVFLAGAEVVFMEAETAATFLHEHAAALVLIAEDDRGRFERAVQAIGIQTRELWSTAGINYSKGRRLRLWLVERGRRAAEPARAN